MQPHGLFFLLVVLAPSANAVLLSAVSATSKGVGNLTAADVSFAERFVKEPKHDPLHASNYKDETTVFANVSVECVFAILYCCLVGSVPVVLVLLIGPEGGLTNAHMVESGVLIFWLLGVIVVFTNIIEFNSGVGHWQGARPLTIVEAVYVLSQILTTVGYGDITPAYPVAQVVVACNVIFALCLYASLIMETGELVALRTQAALEELFAEEAEERKSPNHSSRDLGPLKLKDWKAERSAQVDTSNLRKFSAVFIGMISIGVLFWHFFPGEDKTWLQAIYFSIITLSTVGFGAITAVTPGGMVFAAFWMLFGVASLGGVIGSFVEVMMQTKALERVNPDKEKWLFHKYVTECSHTVDVSENSNVDPKCMDNYDFLKFGLLVKNLATEDELRFIEERYNALKPDEDGNISIDQLIKEGEAPPGYEEDCAKVELSHEVKSDDCQLDDPEGVDDRGRDAGPPALGPGGDEGRHPPDRECLPA